MNAEALTLEDYRTVCRVMGESCRRKLGEAFQSIYSKHKVLDLTPGYSDLDLRAVCSGKTVEEWSKIGFAISQVYLELLRNNPRYSRILEHPPGFIISTEEVPNYIRYHPAVAEWDLMFGFPLIDADSSIPFDQAKRAILKSFMALYGVYRPELDPPVNIDKGLLGTYHIYGRIMHHLAPALKAGMSLILGRQLKSKVEAFNEALQHFPDNPLLKDIQTIMGRAYRVSAPPHGRCLRELDLKVIEFLSSIFEAIRERHPLESWLENTRPARLCQEKPNGEPVKTIERLEEALREWVEHSRMEENLRTAILYKSPITNARHLILVFREGSLRGITRVRGIPKRLVSKVRYALKGGRETNLSSILISTEGEFLYRYLLAYPTDLYSIFFSGETIFGEDFMEWVPPPRKEMLMDEALGRMCILTGVCRSRAGILAYLRDAPPFFATSFLKRRCFEEINEIMVSMLVSHGLTAQGCVPMTLKDGLNILKDGLAGRRELRALDDLYSLTLNPKRVTNGAINLAIELLPVLNRVAERVYSEVFS